ncbi:MAG: competence/damage-inducible protein A [Desulfurellaceae bacterium]|nr:competence/damage-inducible protein A [Desulfurellaceae bacterium]
MVIMCIGDELLAGDIENTNATYLAKKLTDLGSIPEKIVTLPDDVSIVADEIQNYRGKIIITGGLGPTPDDKTREAVAQALNKKIVRDKIAEQTIKEKIREKGIKEKARIENVLKMADLPEGCSLIENDVGVAPGFIVEDRIFVLPGVPKEMKAMFEKIKGCFQGEKIYTEWLKTEKKESQIIFAIKETLKRYNVRVGSYGRNGNVFVKISSINEEEVKKAKQKLKKWV